MWYLYVVRCANDALYTGITTDVARRFAEHQAGNGAKYTRMHPPVALEAVWRYPDRSAATTAEHAFKQFSRAVKLAWIAGRWPFLDAPCAFEVLGESAMHHFCPRCGGRLEMKMAECGEVQQCAVCGRFHYQNAKPAAGVLIVRDGAVLLGRRKTAPYQGYWDVPGGFLEAEELPEVGAVREAREETGLDVRLLDFFGFYMDVYDFQEEHYPILNIYFVGEADGDPRVCDEMDAWLWLPVGEIPEQLGFEHEAQVLTDLAGWVSQGNGDAGCFEERA